MKAAIDGTTMTASSVNGSDLNGSRRTAAA
jgi:hypothetical protein